MEYRYTAVVLGKKDIGEADRLYTLYTKEEGKVTVKAPGSRKPGAKLAAHLETGMMSGVSVMRSRGMGRITSALCEEFFFTGSIHFPIANECMRILSGVSRYTVEYDVNERVFDLLVSFLKNTKSMNSGKEDHFFLVANGFLFQFLSHIGFSFEVFRCVLCREKLEGETFLFDIREGGVICRNCSLQRSQGLTIDQDTVKFLRLFGNNSLENLQKIRVSQKQNDRVRTLLNTCFLHLE